MSPTDCRSIDGTHITIVHPDICTSGYYKHKGLYSIIMQALVDFHGLFMDVYIGWPGKVHNATVSTNFSVYHKGINGTPFPHMSQSIGRAEVNANILMSTGNAE